MILKFIIIQLIIDGGYIQIEEWFIIEIEIILNFEEYAREYIVAIEVIEELGGGIVDVDKGRGI